MAAAAAARHDAPPQPKPATPATAPAAGETVESLTAKLAEANERLRVTSEQHSTLKGKYDAELPRAQDAARKAEAEKKVAQTRVTELEGELKKKIDNLDVTSLSDSERRLAGEDLVQVIAKTAREVVDARIAETNVAISKRVDLLYSMSDDAYFLALDEGVANWATVNDDPKFMSWLNQLDPATNRLRLDRIKRAEGARQGHLVVEIFRAFLEQREIGAPKAAEPTPKPKPHIDPPEGGGEHIVDEANPDGKRYWTRAQIKAHYDGKTQGLWKGKEAEWRTLELDINAAYREKRIRG